MTEQLSTEQIKSNIAKLDQQIEWMVRFSPSSPRLARHRAARARWAAKLA